MDFRQALPVGSVLGGDYRIVDILGQGGFGLTYKAVDTRLGSFVAIKEYFPSDMAFREQGATVRARSSREEGVFSWGRARFLDEARTLARFRQSNIVRVARFFEANNTAYMVLDFEDGPNLADWRLDLGHPPHQADLDRIAAALLGAVEAVHDAGVLHRDIKPANVIMRDGNEPILIDFGAARQSLGARSKTVHAIVTPGYSPKEQYAVDVDRQGAWTDVYALGATLYFLVTGEVPADALSRDLSDVAIPDMDAHASYRPEFLKAIKVAMSVRAEDRPQSIAEWRPMLLGGVAQASRNAGRTSQLAGTAGVVPAQSLTDTVVVGRHSAVLDTQNPVSRRATSKSALLIALAAAGLLIGGIGYYVGVYAPNRDETQWQTARRADTVSAYNAYLAAHPTGRFADAARVRRVALGGGTTAPIEPVPPAITPAQPPASASTSGQSVPPTPTPVTPDQVPEPVLPVATPAQSTPPASTVANSEPLVTTEPAPRIPDPQAPASGPIERPATTAITPPTVLTPAPVIAERLTLPSPLPQATLDRLRQSVTAADWKLAIGIFAGSTVGYSEQSADFIAELDRLSGGKLRARALTGNDAPRGNIVLHEVNVDSRYMAWHSPSQSVARDRAYAVAAGLVPFGLPPAAHVRWLRQEGANLLEQLYRRDRYDVRAIPCGIAGSPGGWLKRELRTTADLSGLQVSGSVLWTSALQKHGAVASGVTDFRAAFNANQVDAVFPLTPLTGVFLRAPLLARFYYQPGVQQGSHVLDLLIGSAQWQNMSEPQRQLVDEACRRNIDKWAAQYTTSQNAVLTQIRAQQVAIRPLPSVLQDALRKSTDDVLAGEAERNPDFKRILDSYKRFRS